MAASDPMSVDFDAAVVAPFRMQPGLRRMADGARHLTPLAAGSRHQREKLAVLSAYAPQALVAVPGFDAAPALGALHAIAAAEHPGQWAVDADGVRSPALGTAVSRDGTVSIVAPGRFGLGDEIARCLRGLPPGWRGAGLLALAFAEDFAVVDADAGTVPWIAAALPSHWAPEDKVGRGWHAVHAPVADGDALRAAGDALLRVVAAGGHWERDVWNVTDDPRLHAHPARSGPRDWNATAPADAWFRSERQTFAPVPGVPQALFTIRVDVVRLVDVVSSPARAAVLHDAVASMSPAVLDYRRLTPVRDVLLGWLRQRS